MKPFLIAVCVMFGTAFAARADESGPKAGENVPALKVFSVVGTQEGKEVDFVANRQDEPTIYLFVQAEEGGLPVGGRPLARFMKALDEQVGTVSERVLVVAVWLGDQAFDKHKDYLPRFQMSMKLEKTSLAAFDGNKSGPNNWGINADVHMTVVIVNKGKVVKSVGFASLNETDVRTVLADLKKAVGK